MLEVSCSACGTSVREEIALRMSVAAAASSPLPRTLLQPTLLQPFYPALNGMRGIAILLVYLDHYGFAVPGFAWLQGGWIGVDLFFVLSGFLITGGLFDTVGERRYLPSFYAKRALRIFPLYYGFWTAALFLASVQMLALPPGWWLWLLYAGNLKTLQQVVHGDLFSLHALYLQGNHVVIPVEINQFWSLCVEEQFYFVWPMVVYFTRDRRRLMGLCILLAAMSLVGRIGIFIFAPHAVAFSEFSYHQTYVRMDGLSMGAFLALWLRGTGPSRLRYRPMLVASASVSLGGFCGYLLYSFVHTRNWQSALTRDLGSPWSSTVALTLAPLLGVALLLACLPGRSWIARACSFRPLQELGRISYGFYLLHLLPYGFLMSLLDVHHPRRSSVLVVTGWFAACWALSSMSYRYFESPFLRMKDRLARSASPTHHRLPTEPREVPAG